MEIVESNIPDIKPTNPPDTKKEELANKVINTVSPLLDETQYQLKIKNEQLSNKLKLIEGNIFELKDKLDNKISKYEKERVIRNLLSIIQKAIQNGSIYTGTLSSEISTFLNDMHSPTMDYLQTLTVKMTETLRSIR